MLRVKSRPSDPIFKAKFQQESCQYMEIENLKIRFKLPFVLKESVESLILSFSEEKYDTVWMLEGSSIEKVEKGGMMKMKCEI